MRIVFKSVEICNFLSIGHTEINLDGNGYVLVNGVNLNAEDGAVSNGSGKSSIWDAICWCITGDTIRGGSKDIRNIHATDGAFVSLVIMIDDVEYKIIRSKNHSVYKTAVQLFKNGENISGGGVRDGNKVIEDTLPELSYQTITSVVFLGQGLPNRFSANTPSGRKGIIESLSKSDFMVEDIKERISARKNELQSRLDSVNNSIVESNTKIRINEKNLENVEQQIANCELEDAYRDRIIDYASKYNDTKASYDVHIKEVEEINEKIKNLAEQKVKAVSEINESFAGKESALNEDIQTITLDVRELTNKKKQNETSIKSGVCPTCGQRLKNISDDEIEKLNDEIASLVSLISEKSDALSDLNVALNNLRAEKSVKIRNLDSEFDVTAMNNDYRTKKAIADMEFTNMAKYDSEKKKAEFALESAVANKERLATEKDNILNTLKEEKDKLCGLNEEYNALKERFDIQSKFSTVVSRDFRTYLISGIVDYISSKESEYSKFVYGHDAVKLNIDKNNIDIVYNDRLYEDLSGGERQKVDIIIQMSIRDMMCQYVGFSSNIIVLDEIFDNLDSSGCDAVLNLLSNKLSEVSSTYIVTHHTDIDIPYDSIITVTKNADGVSSVVCH